MDRVTCINLLIAAGLTWSAASWLFHERVARHLGDAKRREVIEQIVAANPKGDMQ